MPHPVSPLNTYLEKSPFIDFDHPSIQDLIEQREWRRLDEVSQAKAVFEFVRDEIRHSFDANDTVVTCAASDVLAQQTGLCYAKSHLVAALLRLMGVPTGFCYQKLILFEDPEDGYCLHGLNAVYLQRNWVRFDARGNKPGIDAQFSLAGEQLAFPIRPELGEIDFPEVFAEPATSVIQCLTNAQNCDQLYRHGLPATIDADRADKWEPNRVRYP